MAANQFDILTDTRTTADLTVGGQITPATLAVNTDNYAPTHGPVAGVICISSSAAINVTGLLAPDFPLVRHLINVGAYTITLTKQDAASLAANRFLMGGATHDLLPGQGAAVYYHAGLSMWVLLHESTTGGGGSPSDLCVTRTVSASLAIAADTTCIQRRPLIAAGVGVTIDASGEWLIL